MTITTTTTTTITTTSKLDAMLLATLDAVVRSVSAFTSFADLLSTAPSYRPSIDVRSTDGLLLADAYDAAQEDRGDARRAFRYGRDTDIRRVARR